MTYPNSVEAFNAAAANLERLAGVDHFFQILANRAQFAEALVASAEDLDCWDCWLQNTLPPTM